MRHRSVSWSAQPLPLRRSVHADGPGFMCSFVAGLRAGPVRRGSRPNLRGRLGDSSFSGRGGAVAGSRVATPAAGLVYGAGIAVRPRSSGRPRATLSTCPCPGYRSTMVVRRVAGTRRDADGGQLARGMAVPVSTGSAKSKSVPSQSTVMAGRSQLKNVRKGGAGHESPEPSTGAARTDALHPRIHPGHPLPDPTRSRPGSSCGHPCVPILRRLSCRTSAANGG